MSRQMAPPIALENKPSAPGRFGRTKRGQVQS
jgi:hypothetical protein